MSVLINLMSKLPKAMGEMKTSGVFWHAIKVYQNFPVCLGESIKLEIYESKDGQNYKT